MEWFTLIVAVIALVISIWSIKRTGGLVEMKSKVDALSSLGLTEMKKKVDSLSSLSESFREKTADVLDRLEKKVRGEEK
jgi:HAMP domain-containing protein